MVVEAPDRSGGGSATAADPPAPPAADPFALYRAAKTAPRQLRALPALLADAVRLVGRAAGRTFVVVVGLQLAAALLVAAQVVVGQRALERVVDGDGGARSALPALLVLAVVFSASSLVTGVAGHVQRLLAELVLRATWDRLLDVTTSVDLLTFDDPGFHEHQERVQVSALRRPVTVTDGLASVVSGAAGAVLLVVALLGMAPQVVPVVLLAGPAVWAVSRRGARLEFDFVLRTTPTLRERVYLREVLTRRAQAQEVRAYGAAERLRGWHDDKYDRHLVELRRLVRRRCGLALLSAALTVPVLLGTFALLLWLVDSGRTSLAAAGAAAVAIRLLSTRVEQLVRGVAGLYESSLFLADLDAFVGLAGEAAPAEPSPSPVPRQAGRRPFRTLELEAVGFTYPGAAQPALAGVDLEIRAGEVIGLVGENGSGKTTLAKVLAQLYPPTEGRVLWDGVTVDPAEQAALRRHAAVVFQDFARYQLSAHSNVTVAPPDDDERAVRRAVRRAGADDLVGRLPHGYGTVLSRMFPGGVELSGGEWQRIALARALLRDAPFVLMDEPTAALDPRAEHELFEDLRRMLSGRTVVLVSHRLSSVVSADRIVVLDGGRVVETGTHRALSRQGGLYAELFAMQAAAYRKTGRRAS